MPGIILMHDALHTRHAYFVLYIQSAAAAAAALCVDLQLLLLQQLLLFVIVCRTAKHVAGSSSPIPSSALVLFKHGLFLVYVPLGRTAAITASICLYYIVGNYGHARSHDGRQLAAATPSLNHNYIYNKPPPLGRT